MQERPSTTRAKITVACIMLALALGGGWYYRRWYHYFSRPLFYNTYRPDRDGLIWSWDLSPGPLSDYHGRLVFSDFGNNMVAVVKFPTGDDGSEYSGGGEIDSFGIMLGKQFVEIHKMPDTLEEVAESGVRVVRKLGPGEAKRIYDGLDKDSDRTVNNWQHTVHESILQLLAGNSGQPTTR
jgi:hypothetical protein